MQEQLTQPLQRIHDASQYLLGETSLNFSQERLLHAIHTASQALLALIIATPDLTWDKAREVFSFEARDHLASIIGYAELLLDGSEGDLDADQQQYVHQMRAGGKSLLTRLMKLEENA